MKIILSRKGFDSQFGGEGNPILPDGTLLSFPIPSMKYTSKLLYDGKPYEPTQYKDLQIPRNIQDSLLEIGIEGIITYKDLMLHLGIEEIKDKHGSESLSYSLLSQEPLYCHLDPDLIHDVLKRKSNWKGIFGQAGIPGGHLRKQDVEENDLFLYFGWYRKTKMKDKRLIYDNSDKSGRHIIFGYLQIQKKINKQNEDEVKKSDWIYTLTHPHPHLDDKIWISKDNSLYIGRKTLSWNSDYRGWGIFKFDEKLVLTETDPTKNPRKKDATQNRSYWKKSLFPYGMKITFHPNKSYWFGNDGMELPYFKTKSPGQEYVISENKEFEEYVKGLDFLKC